MNRLEILKQIEQDIKDNWTVANGYERQPADVKRGIQSPNDCPAKPCVCFTIEKDVPESGDEVRRLSIDFYIYAEDQTKDLTLIHELLSDLEDFLKTELHYTYALSTLIGDIEIWEGGLSSPLNTAYLKVDIIYNK